MAALGAIVGLAGSVVSAAGTVAAGKAQMEQAKAQAEMQKREAVEEQARYQRGSMQANTERDLVLSKQRTAAAASGFSAQDPSASESWQNIYNEGTYNASMYSYTGKRNKAYGIYQGKLTEWAGERAYEGSKLAAFGTVLGGIGGFFNSFGGGGFSSTASPSPSYTYFGSGSSGAAPAAPNSLWPLPGLSSPYG